ncbi:hypothetical protein [Rhodococcus sp. NPDC003348]
MGILEWLTPERITALGVVATSLLTAWTGRIAVRLKAAEAKVAVLEKQGEKDRGVIKAAARFIREQSVHIAVLCGLLRHHAPNVVIPTEPGLPEELREEV